MADWSISSVEKRECGLRGTTFGAACQSDVSYGSAQSDSYFQKFKVMTTHQGLRVRTERIAKDLKSLGSNTVPGSAPPFKSGPGHQLNRWVKLTPQSEGLMCYRGGTTFRFPDELSCIDFVL